MTGSRSQELAPSQREVGLRGSQTDIDFVATHQIRFPRQDSDQCDEADCLRCHSPPWQRVPCVPPSRPIRLPSPSTAATARLRGAGHGAPWRCISHRAPRTSRLAIAPHESVHAHSARPAIVSRARSDSPSVGRFGWCCAAIVSANASKSQQRVRATGDMRKNSRASRSRTTVSAQCG